MSAVPQRRVDLSDICDSLLKKFGPTGERLYRVIPGEKKYPGRQISFWRYKSNVFWSLFAGNLGAAVEKWADSPEVLLLRDETHVFREFAGEVKEPPSSSDKLVSEDHVAGEGQVLILDLKFYGLVTFCGDLSRGTGNSDIHYEQHVFLGHGVV